VFEKSHEPEWRTERFEFARVEQPREIPRHNPRVIDVALLDMHHGFTNLGHNAIVALVRDAAVASDDALARAGQRVRLVSYAVRDKLMVPHHARGRHRLYLGTGGPGHLDPRRNTHARGLQEIQEDPSWELPLWRLFEAIAADDDAAMFGVCHTFGLLCRWSGVAQPVLRGPEKSGPKSGVSSNVLTPQAIEHPWFATLSHSGVPVLDSRYYDLVPAAPTFPAGLTPIAFDSLRADDCAGQALTMLELARERDGSAPRIFAVNSHPEIGSPQRVGALLDRMLANGMITAEYHTERSAAILPMLRGDRGDERLAVARRLFGDLVHRHIDRLARAA
jgi:hypothetical protein